MQALTTATGELASAPLPAGAAAMVGAGGRSGMTGTVGAGSGSAAIGAPAAPALSKAASRTTSARRAATCCSS